MNKASQWRLELATTLAQAYAREPDVAAVMVGGSTARGHADRYSDVELGVFWRRPPTAGDRRRIMAAVAADNKRLFPFDSREQVWVEEYFVGRAAPAAEASGQFVEVLSATTDHMERSLAEVLQQSDPHELKQNLIAAVQQGVTLEGAPLLDAWRLAAAGYPDTLAAAVVGRYGQIDHFWRHRMWLARDNRFMLNKQIADVQRSLLHMLLAVNRVYYFGFKWLDVVLGQCPLAPPDFLARFRHIAAHADAAAAERLAALVEEGYDLVAAHVPGVDVDRLRAIFRWQRPAWGDTGPPIPM